MIAALAVAWQTLTIDAILDAPPLQGAVCAVLVVDDQGRTVYERNGDLRLMPASNQKLLSCAFAMHTLGPAYAPTTRFWMTSRGLIVDTPGDPSMTFAKLRGARRKLEADHAYRVYVRQAYRPGYGPGWEWDDLPNRYAPTVSALTLERGGFELWGNAQRFWIKPDAFGIRIDYHGGTVARRNFDLAKRRLDVYGPRPKTEGFIEAFALPNPDHLAAGVLGGPFYRTDSVPSDPADLEIVGDTVGKLVADCLPASDNFLAESLMFMAAAKSGPLGDNAYATAAKRMKEFLVKTVGLAEGEVDPYDGSGLSRHNNVTARGLVKLLQWAKRQPWGAQWVASMAAPGSGTLRNRLKDTGFRGKTGTLNKVSSLSGYCTKKDGRELVVSVILNHYLGPDQGARDAQDAIIRILESGPHGTANPRSTPISAFALSHAGHSVADADRLSRSRQHGDPVRPWAHH